MNVKNIFGIRQWKFVFSINSKIKRKFSLKNIGQKWEVIKLYHNACHLLTVFIFFRNNVKQKISMVNDVGELVFHGKNFIGRCTKYVLEKNINTIF